ncbi:hypothetical protein ABBQ32_001235 [Trebouxia sp. C0010 RCD-2024]
MGQADGDAAVEALCILAKSFLASGQTSQAVKCLEAVCRSSAPMPVPAAKTRLWLAQVLLQHTLNIPEATHHLQKAQFLLKNVHACQSLKCEVLSELGRCQRYLARPKLEIQQYERGIQVCVSGNPSSEKDARAQWLVHFALRIMDVHVADAKFQTAHQWANQALHYAQETSNTASQVVVLLAQIQLHMLSRQTAAALELLFRCSSLFREQAQQPHPQPQPLWSQLQLHFCILRVLVMLTEGRYEELVATGGSQNANTTISEMEQLVEQIQGAQWQYAWLPTGAVQALVCWLAATILRPPGRFPQAMSYFSRGQQAIDEELKRHHIGMQATEAELAVQTVCGYHCLLFIKFLIIEGAILVHLTQLDLAQAQRDLGALLDMCTTYPTLLGHPLHASTFMLIGHYAMAVGDAEAAAAKFMAAAKSNPSGHQACLAAVSAALALLATGQAEDLLKAADLLQHQQLFKGLDASLPYAERCGGLFASATVLIRQGQEQEGKLRMTKALKYAHSHLGNHQLVAQVLNVLAPAQLQRGDTMGASSMLQSSFTLSKGLHDLPTMLSALQGISDFYSQTGDVTNFDKNSQYISSKRTAYVHTIENAVHTAEHGKIVQWQGFS